MNDGKLVSEMLAKDASQEKIMRAILRADTKRNEHASSSFDKTGRKLLPVRAISVNMA